MVWVKEITGETLLSMSKFFNILDQHGIHRILVIKQIRLYKLIDTDINGFDIVLQELREARVTNIKIEGEIDELLLAYLLS